MRDSPPRRVRRRDAYFLSSCLKFRPREKDMKRKQKTNHHTSYYDYGGPVHPSPDGGPRRADDVEAEQTRRARAETREGAGLCGDQQEDVRGDYFRSSRDPTRGTMWKTASASSPIGRTTPGPASRRPHTHKVKEPCTKIARAGTCSFLPISQ